MPRRHSFFFETRWVYVCVFLQRRRCSIGSVWSWRLGDRAVGRRLSGCPPLSAGRPWLNALRWRPNAPRSPVQTRSQENLCCSEPASHWLHADTRTFLFLVRVAKTRFLKEKNPNPWVFFWGGGLTSLGFKKFRFKCFFCKKKFSLMGFEIC